MKKRAKKLEASPKASSRGSAVPAAKTGETAPGALPPTPGAVGSSPAVPPSVTKLARFRVPEDVDPSIGALADRALQRIEDVLEGRVEANMAGHVLRAAGMAREEVCGQVPKDINVKGVLSISDLVRAAALPPAEPEVEPE
jgi:hypothetical protein